MWNYIQHQIINDYVDTPNENDLVEDAEYFNQQDELLFDAVVKTLNNLNINSPDSGYSTELSSSEPSLKLL
jgi:hypothetical protein